MIVKLLDATSLTLAAKAAKLCIGQQWTGDDEATYLKTLIQRGHESVLEHVVYVFEVTGLSRACLQQLARHRHISLSVKSTRWAMDKHEDYYTPPEIKAPNDIIYDGTIALAMNNAMNFKKEYGNDVAKYLLPECVTTDLILTLNLRELRHIYKLRTGRTAIREFQDLSKALVACLPEDEAALVRYKSDALERAVRDFLDAEDEEIEQVARERLERMVE